VKKNIAALFFVIVSNMPLFADAEIWAYTGFEYGNGFEVASGGGYSAKTYMSSPGVSLSAYEFWNGKNIGLFVHTSYLFPQTGMTNLNGTVITGDLDDYDFLMQFGIIIGPGFRHSLTEKVNLIYGAGLHFMETGGRYNRDLYVLGDVYCDLRAVTYGIGADFALKYDFNEVLFITLGSVFTLGFATRITLSSSFLGNYSGLETLIGGYFLADFRPYICVGLNFYRSAIKIGKPKDYF
jgi:hypothetical protein